MRQGIATLNGYAVTWRQDNVNTDQIIPSREMKRVSRKGLAQGLFANLRYLDAAQGGRTPNPAFFLNTADAARATFLISGANFGCGSSREHAVWALRDFGFRAILAESFGSIFRDNCVANGIVPVALARADLDRLANLARGHEIRLDLRAAALQCDALTCQIPLTERQLDMLRGGLSQIDLTLRHGDQIRRFRERDRVARPWIYAAQEHEQ